MSGEHHKARELWATFVKEAKVIKSKSFIEVGKQRLQDLDKDIESRNKDKTFWSFFLFLAIVESLFKMERNTKLCIIKSTTFKRL